MDPKLTAGFIEAKVKTSKQQIAKAFLTVCGWAALHLKGQSYACGFILS
jgi:hypothetical protein